MKYLRLPALLLPLWLPLSLLQIYAAEFSVSHWSVRDAETWDAAFRQMRHLTQPDFAADSVNALQEQGYNAEVSKRLFSETAIAINIGKSPTVIFSHSDAKVAQLIAESFVRHCIDDSIQTRIAAIEKAKQSNNAALHHELSSRLDDRNHWSLPLATTDIGTASPAAPSPAEPHATNTAAPSAAIQLRLKHFHDNFKDVAELETHIFSQLRQFHSERFRQRCISFLGEQGLSATEATQLLSRASIRYDVKTRELLLTTPSNADAAQLKALAQAIRQTFHWLSIDEAIRRAEEAKRNNGTAYIERASTQLDGGEYSNWFAPVAP